MSESRAWVATWLVTPGWNTQKVKRYNFYPPPPPVLHIPPALGTISPPILHVNPPPLFVLHGTPYPPIVLYAPATPLPPRCAIPPPPVVLCINQPPLQLFPFQLVYSVGV